MDDSILLLIALSAAVQFTAAYFAFRLVRITGAVPAWICLSIAFLLMALRRSSILWRAVYHPDAFQPDPLSEWFGLLISGLLLLGVLAIANYFGEKQKSARDLQESRKTLERVQEAGRLGSYRYDLESDVWNASKTLLEIYGVEEGVPVECRNWTQRVHPGDRRRVEAEVGRIRANPGNPFEFDFRILRRPDGEARHLHCTGVFERDPSGRPTAVAGTVQDVTERVRNLESLRESEQRYRRIVENLNDGYIIHDFDGVILDCNENLGRMLGYDREELVGRSFRVIDSPQEADRYAERTTTLRTRGKVEFDGHHLARDGRKIPVSVSARLISPEGKGMVQSFVRDITERKEAEKALRESEQRFRTLAESLPQAVFEADLTGRLTYANQSAFHLFGYSQEEFNAGLTCAEMMAPEERDRAVERYQEILWGGTPTPGHEYLAARKDGTRFPVVIFTNVKREGGKVTGTLGIIVDATESRKMEAERRKLQEQFFQAQKMESIGTLAGGIAHDFNNLLGGLLGSLSLMEMDAADKPELLQEVEEMKALVKRGAGMTRQLLGFARRGKYDAKPIDLGEVVRLTTELFQRTRKDLVFKVETGEQPVSILADRSQIEQVMMNLLVNAGQAMPEGGSLSARVDRVEPLPEELTPHGLEAGAFARVTLVDTGVGMDAATMERIFEPFFTTKEAGKGTGLGLASVYGIVKNHGGFVKVQSAPGKGSSFQVYLPLAPQASGPERGDAPAAEGRLLDGRALSRHTILLVDDEEPILRTSARILETLGFQVLTAGNGTEALDLFRARRDEIAAVVLDMVMPGMSGLETFEALRTMDPRVKVLLASGYSREGQAQLLVESGCQGFIEKPFDLQDLSQKLRELL